MSNTTVCKSCTNLDCDNVEIYELETDNEMINCPNCETKLEVINIDVDMFEQDEEDEETETDDKEIEDLYD